MIGAERKVVLEGGYGNGRCTTICWQGDRLSIPCPPPIYQQRYGYTERVAADGREIWALVNEP